MSDEIPKNQVGGAGVPPYEVLAREWQVRPEILEVAEEIADGSDVIGIEKWRLEWLLRAALYVDRQVRERDESARDKQ